MTTRKQWDEYDAYLFDIDGTLLHCADAVHYFAFCDALSELAGRPVNLDGVTAHGNTDIGILRDAFRIAGVQEERWRPRITEMRKRMVNFVAAHREELSITVLPAVRETLNHLRRRGASIGVATGNLEGIGQIKLETAGLLSYFSFGGYSDEVEFRRDVFAQAASMARRIAGEHASLCVVGDTPEDIRAARANYLDVVAVASGVYSYEELQKQSPDWCLRSLEELLQ